jgi:hypothetical protein
MTLHHTDDPSTAARPDPDDTPDRSVAAGTDTPGTDTRGTDPAGDLAPYEEAGPPVLDRTVFGVAAAIVLAFIAWGVFGTENLSAVAKAVLGGVITGGGWAFCSPRAASSSSPCGWP